MVFIHFFESGTNVLTQYVKTVPSVDEDIKIKGRKGKVVRVDQINDRVIHVYLLFDPVVKKSLLVDNKKKKR